MSVKYQILLELYPSEFDTLKKSIERFRKDSSFFDNGEYEVNADEVKKKILKNCHEVEK